MTYSQLESEAKHFFLEFSRSLAQQNKSGKWISELVIRELSGKTMSTEMLVKEYAEAMFLALEKEASQSEDAIRYFILGTLIYCIDNRSDAASAIRETVNACLSNYIDSDKEYLYAVMRSLKRSKGQAIRYFRKKNIGKNEISKVLGNGFADGINEALNASTMTFKEKTDAVESAGVSQWYRGYFIDYIKDSFWP